MRMFLLIRGTRHGTVRWRAAMYLAVPATLLFPVAPLLSAGLMLRDYRTDVPLETFQAMTYVSLAMSVVFGFLLMGAAAALIVTFYPGRAALAAPRRTPGDGAGCHRGAAGRGGDGGRRWPGFRRWLEAFFHDYAVLSIGSPEIIASAAPALAAVTGAVRGVVTDAALLGTDGDGGVADRQAVAARAAVLAALCASVPSQVRTPGEFLLHYAHGAFDGGGRHRLLPVFRAAQLPGLRAAAMADGAAHADDATGGHRQRGVDGAGMADRRRDGGQRDLGDGAALLAGQAESYIIVGTR